MDSKILSILFFFCSLRRVFSNYQDTTTCGYQRADLAPELSIAGGGYAQPGKWPWQVAFIDGNAGFTCGGQLVKEDWVLTASHCVTHLNNPTAHTIMMGGVNLNNFTDDPNAQVRTVRAFYPHPLYSTLISDFDVVLIQLEEPFVLTDYVTTICLARRGMESIYEAGTAMTVTGWGAQEDMGPVSRRLKEVVVPVVAHDQCRLMYLGEDDITEKMMCASVPEGGKGSCSGDSGGPLVTKVGDQWWLAGTVLGGNGCGSADFPSVYENVVQFQDWIAPIFRDRLPDYQDTQCSEDQFGCKEGWCIDYWRRCNGVNDCSANTDELYCQDELKNFDVQFSRRLNYRSIFRNSTVADSVVCARECLATVAPTRCAAFDTMPNGNSTRLCSMAVEDFDTLPVSVVEQERDRVSHFTVKFKPKPNTVLRNHIGHILSPNYLGIRRTTSFHWVLDLKAPNSNTIIFTILSARSPVGNDCENVNKMAMIAVKAGRGRQGQRRKNKRQRKSRGAKEQSAAFCLGLLEEGMKIWIHSLQSRVTFYTTSSRHFAFQMSYETEYNCSETFTSANRLKTPGYPDSYPILVECKWTYRAPPGKVVSVSMRDFDIEEIEFCEFDYLEIFDGDSENAQSIGGRRCGEVFDGPVTSTGNEILIAFVSDSEVTRKGFIADISFVRPGSRRTSQHLIADDRDEVNEISTHKDGDTNILLHSLWGTAVGALFVITVMGAVCYRLKKRLDAARHLVRNIKRNNIVFDSQ